MNNKIYLTKHVKFEDIKVGNMIAMLVSTKPEIAYCIVLKKRISANHIQKLKCYDIVTKEVFEDNFYYFGNYFLIG